MHQSQYFRHPTTRYNNIANDPYIQSEAVESWQTSKATANNCEFHTYLTIPNSRSLEDEAKIYYSSRLFKLYSFNSPLGQLLSLQNYYLDTLGHVNMLWYFIVIRLWYMESERICGIENGDCFEWWIIEHQGPFAVSCPPGQETDYAQPIIGQIIEITCPVIDQAQPEPTPSKREKTGPGQDELDFVVSIASGWHLWHGGEPTVRQVACPRGRSHWGRYKMAGMLQRTFASHFLAINCWCFD